MHRRIYLYITLTLSFLAISACSSWDNFITYFNTYYNAERLIDLSEDQFEYYEEQRRVEPDVIMYEPEYMYQKRDPRGIPEFMREFEITPTQRQAMAVKIDSVIIKGSKILAHHPKSDYVEGSLFLMAKAYFYRNEYLPSQIKCSELVDKFPGGDYSPDAHLLFAKNLLMQRNFEFGALMLSRCIDIAWQKERYDILTEAFRLQAESALYFHDKDEAVKPYLRAIAQSEDWEFAASMQNELASIYYRLGMFEEAAEAFEKVSEYSPSYVETFESELYRAISLSRIDKSQEALEILADISTDGKYEEWKDYAEVGKLYVMNTLVETTEIAALEQQADTSRLTSNNRLLAVYYFDKGAKFYEANDYTKANSYFSKAKSSKTPALETASFLSQNIGDILRSKKKLGEISDDSEVRDSIQSELNQQQTASISKGEKASLRFDIGRAFEKLGKADSAYAYYKSAAMEAPDNENAAQYYHAWQRLERDKENYFVADSIAEHLIYTYPETEYGQDAMEILGFVKEHFVVDTLAELYSSGQELRRNGDYEFAIKQYLNLYKKAKTSSEPRDFAPKALYAVGWTYEKHLQKIDSSSRYFYMLLEEYPNSKYAKEFLLSKTYVEALRSGEKLPDSLIRDPNRTIVPEYKAVRFEAPLEVSSPNKKSNNPFDLISDPGALWDKGKEMIGNTIDGTINSIDSTVNSTINDIDSLRNMEMPSLEDIIPPSDSTGTNKADSLATPPDSIPKRN